MDEVPSFFRENGTVHGFLASKEEGFCDYVAFGMKASDLPGGLTQTMNSPPPWSTHQRGVKDSNEGFV